MAAPHPGSFIGSNDPRTPIGLGWLRASHRKLDPRLSLPYRPWHAHDEIQKLKPGEVVQLDVEIWPTCIVGTDAGLAHAPHPMKGVGPFTHSDPRDRHPGEFAGRVTLHFDRKPYLLLPVIPRT